MIWICLLFGIAVVVGSLLFLYESVDETLGAIGCVFGSVGIIVCLVIIGMFSHSLASLRVVDEKIEILQAENEAIEQQMAVIVQQYQEHEKEVFSEVSPESAIQLVTLYPELKSDTLVARQMEIYYANHEALRDLKLSKANESVYRWWLYFGGGKK